MSPLVIGATAVLCILCGATVGLLLRNIIPSHHLRDDSKDAVKIATGLMATLCALVLGLLVSSAKDSFDSMNSSISEGSAMLILLDRTLANYGPETRETRITLRNCVIERMKLIWPEKKSQLNEFVFEQPPAAEIIKAKLLELSPNNDFQRSQQIEAMQLCKEILQMRWLTIERAQISLPPAFVIILLFWLAILFACIGLCTPANKTVLAVVSVCAISIGSAVFLIEEMNDPLTGTVKVSNAPLLNAIQHIGL